MQSLYDVDFRRAVIKFLCEDIIYRDKVLPFLKESYFPEQTLKIIFKAVKSLAYKKDKHISKQELKTEVADILIQFEISDASIFYDEINEIFSQDYDSDFLKEKLTQYIKREDLRSSLTKAIDLFEKGEYDTIQKVMERSFDLQLDEDVGSTLESPEDFIKRYRNKYSPSNLIKTGYKELDKTFVGGFASGELHTIVAPPKRFKSTFAVNIGFNVLKQRKAVIHITLELSELDIQSKYYQLIGRFKVEDLMSLEEEKFKEKTSKIINLLRPQLFIKYYEPNTVTVQTIKSYINNLIREGKLNTDIGLIIVDYDDLLLATSGEKDMYQKGGEVYSDLIRLANHFNCPVLTLAQPKREAWSLDYTGEYIRAEHLAHSSKKVHYCFSISSLNLRSSISGNEKVNIVLYSDMVRRGISQREVKLVAYPEYSLITEEE